MVPTAAYQGNVDPMADTTISGGIFCGRELEVKDI
jgi:hypothetical protein